MTTILTEMHTGLLTRTAEQIQTKQPKNNKPLFSEHKKEGIPTVFKIELQ